MRLDEFLGFVRGNPMGLMHTGAMAPFMGSMEHPHLLVHADDVDVSVAFGARGDEYSEDWTDALPDQRAWRTYVDYRYRGAVILRRSSVIVWGGRYLVPKPTKNPTEGFDFHLNGVDAAVDRVLYNVYCPAAGLALEETFARAKVTLV